MNFKEYVTLCLRNFLNVHKGNASLAAKSLGVPVSTFASWVRGSRKPSIEHLNNMFERLNIQFHEPIAQESINIQAESVPTENSTSPGETVSSDYLSIPLLSQCNAGFAIIDHTAIKESFIIYRNIESLKFRSNLIAVRISKDDESMFPVLRPGDIIVVDKSDRVLSKESGTYLVSIPKVGVSVRYVSLVIYENETKITCFSESSNNYPPRVYSLVNDFMGNSDNFIIGRVVARYGPVKSKK